jgi:hypothetical protein
MESARAKSLRIASVFMVLFAAAQSHGQPASNVLEKTLAFPPPVQWKAGSAEISLVGVAGGRADSPKMISKGREDIHVKKPEFYADRPYVLALGFRAKLLNVASVEMYLPSGLGLIRNADGDIEAPMELTSVGFVPFSGSPGTFDVHFNRSGSTEYWDLFPVSADQKEFLFQVVSPSGLAASSGNAKLSFRIIRRDEDFVILNTTPTAEECLNVGRDFVGTVGASSRLNAHLTRENETVSGTEQYVRIGTTLWLQGKADSLGNLVIEERYPKGKVTGIFKGKISEDCRAIRGFFSKPDGSALQPFELHQAGAVSQHDASQSDPERE